MISMRDVRCPFCFAIPGERCWRSAAAREESLFSSFTDTSGYMLRRGAYHKERLQELNRVVMAEYARQRGSR